LLWHVGLRWQSLLAKRLEPIELTPAQFTLLATVLWLERAQGDEPPVQREVAAYAGVDPMMTSQVLRGLEERGLVQRRDDPADRRARRVSVTAAGGRVALEGIARAQQASRDFFDAALGDTRPLVGALRRLAEAGGPVPGALPPAARPAAGRTRRRSRAR